MCIQTWRHQKLSSNKRRFTYNLIEFFVLFVGIVWKIFVQVILGDSVYNIFLIASVLSHIQKLLSNSN